MPPQIRPGGERGCKCSHSFSLSRRRLENRATGRLQSLWNLICMREKKKSYFIIAGFLALNLVAIYAIHAVLLIGTRAQETFNYSCLKGLETQGMLTTNIAAIVATPAGAHLLKLNVLGQFQFVALGILILVTAANLIALSHSLFSMKSGRSAVNR